MTLRKIINIAGLMLLFVSPIMRAQTKSASLQKADSLYEQGNYLAATEEYEKSLKNKPTFSAYYNLGNAYYRQKQLGRAVLNYQRALRLNPASSDVRFNLALCESKTIDSYDTRADFFFIDWLQKLRGKLATNQWGWLGLMCIGLASLFFVIFLRNKSAVKRKIYFSLFVVSIACFVLANSLAYWQWRYYNATTRGVVVVEQATLYSSPDNSAKSLSDIHEGTVVATGNTKEGWIFVTLPDESAGWIKKETLEII